MYSGRTKRVGSRRGRERRYIRKIKQAHHLKSVPFALGLPNNPLQHTLLVQSEAPSQIANPRAEHDASKQVGAPGDQLSLEVPAVDTAVACIPSSRDDVVVSRLLGLDELGYELRMVAEVGIHDDDIVPRNKLQAMHISRP